MLVDTTVEIHTLLSELRLYGDNWKKELTNKLDKCRGNPGAASSSQSMPLQAYVDAVAPFAVVAITADGKPRKL